MKYTISVPISVQNLSGSSWKCPCRFAEWVLKDSRCFTSDVYGTLIIANSHLWTLESVGPFCVISIHAQVTLG